MGIGADLFALLCSSALSCSSRHRRFDLTGHRFTSPCRIGHRFEQRDGAGKPYVLPSVLEAEQRLFHAKADKEYLPITGLGEFTKLSAELAYGKDSKPIQEGRVAIAQSISGTGALRIGTAFLARFYPGAKAIYLPAPSWGNHTPIAKDSGLEVKQYTYFDKETVGLNFEGMKRDIQVSVGSSSESCRQVLGP